MRALRIKANDGTYIFVSASWLLCKMEQVWLLEA